MFNNLNISENDFDSKKVTFFYDFNSYNIFKSCPMFVSPTKNHNLFFGKTSKYSRDPNKTGENLFWIFFLSKAE